MVQYLETSKDDVKQVRTNEVTVRLLCFQCTVDTSKRHILRTLPGFQAFLDVDDIYGKIILEKTESYDVIRAYSKQSPFW